MSSTPTSPYWDDAYTNGAYIPRRRYLSREMGGRRPRRSATRCRGGRAQSSTSLRRPSARALRPVSCPAGAGRARRLHPWRLLDGVRQIQLVASGGGRARPRLGRRDAELHLVPGERGSPGSSPRSAAPVETSGRHASAARSGWPAIRPAAIWCRASICADISAARRACASASRNVVSICGLHDLRPILKTTMNKTLRLDAAEAARESPALLSRCRRAGDLLGRRARSGRSSCARMRCSPTSGPASARSIAKA